MHHIFDPKHNFQPLVEKYGSEEMVAEVIVRSLGDLPEGNFRVTRYIDGQQVMIRGNFMDGVPRIGTAFTPDDWFN